MSKEEDLAPDWFSTPGDSILSLLRRRNIPAIALAGQLDGNMSTLRAVLAGTYPIDAQVARAISSVLGGTVEFWVRRQLNYDIALDRAVEAIDEKEAAGLLAYVATPSRKPLGKISDKNRKREVRQRLAFYNVNGLRAWEAHYGAAISATRFRTSGTFNSDEGAVSLWLREGEIEAQLVSTRPWDPLQLRKILSDISRLSMIRHPTRMLPKLRQLLASVGVAVVILKAPPGCRASGASRFLDREKAMILLSLRHKTDDHFWFTLFHELAHLLLHGERTFIDEEGMILDEAEKEANDFARDCIIPPWRKNDFARLLGTRDAILRFSVSIGVGPGLVIGQMQHRGMVGYDRLNFLKRRFRWSDVQAVLD